MKRILLLCVLVLSGVFELYQTFFAFRDSTWVLKILNVPDSGGAQTLNHIVAWFLLLVTALIGLSFFWVIRNKSEGRVLSVLLGLWWMGIGAGIYFVSGITMNLVTDSAKGLLICLLAF